MSKKLSRRALIAAGLAVAAAGVAGCTKAVRAGLDTTSSTLRDSGAHPVGTQELAASGAVNSTPPGTSSPSSALTAATSPQSSASTGEQSLTSSAEAPAPPTVTSHSGPATEIAHGPRDQPRVALTFHGAGDISLARQILQIAELRGAGITVMVVGTWLADNPSIAGEILAGGHQLGNHTWSHQDINSMAEVDMSREVLRCRDLLIQTAGTPGAFFRQSQSPTANSLMRQVAGAAGYAVSLSYDVDSMDWTNPGAAAVRKYVATAQAGSIVSMHLGHQDTIDALPDVLDDLAGRGLAAVTAGALLAG